MCRTPQSKESHCNTAQRPRTPSWRLHRRTASTMPWDGDEAQFGCTQARAAGRPLHPTHVQRCVMAWGCGCTGPRGQAAVWQAALQPQADAASTHAKLLLGRMPPLASLKKPPKIKANEKTFPIAVQGTQSDTGEFLHNDPSTRCTGMDWLPMLLYSFPPTPQNSAVPYLLSGQSLEHRTLLPGASIGGLMLASG